MHSHEGKIISCIWNSLLSSNFSRLLDPKDRTQLFLKIEILAHRRHWANIYWINECMSGWVDTVGRGLGQRLPGLCGHWILGKEKEAENHPEKELWFVPGTWAMDGMLEWVGFYNRLTSLPVVFLWYIISWWLCISPLPTAYPEISHLQSWYVFINFILVLAAIRLNEWMSTCGG